MPPSRAKENEYHRKRILDRERILGAALKGQRSGLSAQAGNQTRDLAQRTRPFCAGRAFGFAGRAVPLERGWEWSSFFLAIA
jgi:hypothetical protein